MTSSDSPGESGPSSDPPVTTGQPPLAYEGPEYERPATASPTEAQLESETPGGIAAHISPAHDAYAAWRYRAFRLFSIGWLVSLIGNQMTTAAVLYEIYEYAPEGKGAQYDGFLGLITAIPLMLLALPAGSLADRFNRASIVLWGNVVATLSSIALVFISWWLGHLHGDVGWRIWLFYLPPLFTNIAYTFTRAARAALLPQLVPPTVFNNAITWNSSIFETSSMIGPALGGLLLNRSFHWFQSGSLIYGINVLTSIYYVVVLAIIARIHVPRHMGMKAERRLTDGLRFVWSRKVVLGAITLDLFAVLLGGATYLFPLFAHRLGVGEVGYGFLRCAPAVGAFGMAMLTAHLPPVKFAGRRLLFAVAAFGAATIVFGLSPWFWLSLLMLVLVGAFDNISVVIRHTLVQIVTPDVMRGRVSAVNNVFIGTSNELGGFESGQTAQWFGPIASVVGGGVCTIFVVVFIAIFFPQLRRFGSLQEAAEKTSRADALAAAGHCAHCGYDLTGNVSGICPECGTTVPAVAIA